jgi:hypothetical protein
MGTRNLTAVMSDGKYVIAQYGQWDGYPSGQGATALDFCRKHLKKPAGRAAFKDRLARCRFGSEEEIRKFYDDEGIGEFMNMNQAAAFKKKYPTIDRDLAAGVLEHVWNATEPVVLKDSIDFAGDSLFCEYAYVIDLDKGTFEAFKGFVKEPLAKGERFADSKPDRTPSASGDTYYPVRNVGTWSLEDLPTKRELEEAFKSEDDEE